MTLEIDLIQGENNIFEVQLNNELIYTNNKECSVFPETEDLIRMIKEKTQE